MTTHTNTIMKAMTISKKDRKVRLVSVPKPTPQKGEVLVKVVAAALDTATDQFLDGGLMGSLTHSSTSPLSKSEDKEQDGIILGWHFAGTVVGLGPDQDVGTGDDETVHSYQIGDAVWGHLAYDSNQKQGSFSEYITVDVTSCAPKPTSITFQEAAAASTESMTALQALRDEAGLKENTTKTVLINGAGGGVGSIALGIAKHLGATHVTAVCGTKDVQRVKSLGADVVLDYRKQDQHPFANKNGRNYDIIFDTAATLSVPQSLKYLTKGGVYVTTLPSWNWLWGYLASWFQFSSSKKVRLVLCHSKKDDLELIGTWLAQGKTKNDGNNKDGLSVTIDSHYKIIDLEQALLRQRDRTKVGRVVLNVDGNWE